MATLCFALLAGTQCAPDAAGPDALETATPAVVGAGAEERNLDAFTLAETTSPSEHISIQPGADTLPRIGDTITLRAALYILNNAPLKVSLRWTMLDPTIARLEGLTSAKSQTVRVRGLAKGLARIMGTVENMADTAYIWVTPPSPPTAPTPAKVRIQPDSVKISSVEGTGFFSANVQDANNVVIPDLLLNWSSLDPGIATTTQTGVVTGVKSGTARIVARYGTFADTGRAIVGSSESSTTKTYEVVLSPSQGTISTIGGTLQFTAAISRSSGATLTDPTPAWKSLNQNVATVSSTGLVRAVAAGTTRIVGSYSGAADTATVTVGAPTSGGKTYVVVLTPSSGTISSAGGTLQFTAAVSELNGPSVVGVTLAWKSLETAIASVSSSGMVTGLAAGTARIVASYSGAADTATVTVGSPPPPPTSPTPTGQLTPGSLIPVVGRLVARNKNSVAPLSTYDQRYLQTEGARYKDFLGCLSGCITTANHYGGLRSRLMWAIRNGEPIGPAATSENYAYGRGRRIVRTYLAYSKQWNFATQPHNNTGLADIEAYYLLEGDPDAYNHIWVTAAIGTSDPYGYTNCTHSNSDARQGTVYLQSMASAHRLRIPHSRPPANGGITTDMSRGSWLADGRWMIARVIAGCVRADGSVPSPAHGKNVEAFLFNAWLASTFLQWHGYVEPNSAAFDAARRIMDHMIMLYRTVYQPKGWSTLPYLTYSTYAAEDLAGYYVWPALALWQETGDAKYKDFALSQIASMNRTSSISGLKQWNQMYATQGQSAETLLSGVRWR
jgi:hypothetical protein